MTSNNQTSSGGKAILVSSSPELLTRPASKPGDRPISSTGELCTSRIGRRREPAQPGACIGCGDESHFLSARADLKRPNHFLALNRTELHFSTLRALRRSGCSACSAYPYKKIRSRVAVSKDSEIVNVHESPGYRRLSEIIGFEPVFVYVATSLRRHIPQNRLW